MHGLEAEKIQPKRICQYTKLYRIVFREKVFYKKVKDTEDRHRKYKTSQYSRGEKNGL